jgi:hypothetical protein
MKTILRPRSFGMLILVLILAAAVYGFADTNTVPATYAGDGSGTISGYEICFLSYDIYTADSDPSNIDQIDFELHVDGASCASPVNAGTVYVSFTGGAPWTDCSPGVPASSISCSVNQAVDTALSLRVIATD